MKRHIYAAHYGQRVSVHSTFGGYPLPEGLPEGAEVTLEHFDTGYFRVDYYGRKFQVFLSNVGDGGRLPKLNPQPVHPGCKPRVRAPQGRDFPERR